MIRLLSRQCPKSPSTRHRRPVTRLAIERLEDRWIPSSTWYPSKLLAGEARDRRGDRWAHGRSRCRQIPGRLFTR
jgi:hypothetical protein